jgi:glycosyltransferase involved in cell wall biosynthesis
VASARPLSRDGSGRRFEAEAPRGDPQAPLPAQAPGSFVPASGNGIVFSTVIATIGRPTLGRTLGSIKSQRGGDVDIEVIVVADEGDAAARRIFEEQAAERPVWRFEELTGEGWGYPQRQRGIDVARGDYLLFIDDDDVYTPGAFEKIRAAVAMHPGRIVVFRMDVHGSLIWRADPPFLRVRNVGMEMVAIPRLDGKLGAFRPPLRYTSDFDFIAETVALQREPVWSKDVIAIFNQDAGRRRARRVDPVSRFIFRARGRLKRRTRVKAFTSRLRQRRRRLADRA